MPPGGRVTRWSKRASYEATAREEYGKSVKQESGFFMEKATAKQ